MNDKYRMVVNGVLVEMTPEDCEEAVRNDCRELLQRYNPNIVNIRRKQAGPGELLHLEIGVRAPSYYLSGKEDLVPKSCNGMSAEMIVKDTGYPLMENTIEVYYPVNRRLASANVFRSGKACIDKHVPLKSTILNVADKILNDMIYNTKYNRFDSPACSELVDWHRGRKPTIDPKSLYPRRSSLPPRRKALPPRVG